MESPDPPTVEEIIAVMRAAGDDPDGVRLRGLIVVLWRAGLRISEALALAESDLDRVRGAIQVRHGLCRVSSYAEKDHDPQRFSLLSAESM
jgi:integrase